MKKLIQYKKCKNTVNRLKKKYGKDINVVTFFDEFWKKYGKMMSQLSRE